MIKIILKIKKSPVTDKTEKKCIHEQRSKEFKTNIYIREIFTKNLKNLSLIPARKLNFFQQQQKT